MSKKNNTKKKNLSVLIDGENISAKKAEAIMEVASNQGELYKAKVYGRQKDDYTKNWSNKAKKCGIEDIRLTGGPSKDKVDKKIQKDAKTIVRQDKNVDVVCIATNDAGYAESIRDLRSQGKRVIGIGGKQAPEILRKSCSSFVEI